MVLWNDRHDGWGIYTTCMAVVMHFLWMMRAIAIPALAMAGSAVSFATREGAQETVIDGMAIGFIFELDDLFFDHLFGERLRRRRTHRRSVFPPTHLIAAACHVSSHHTARPRGRFPPEVIEFQRSFGQFESFEDDSHNFWIVHVR